MMTHRRPQMSQPLARPAHLALVPPNHHLIFLLPLLLLFVTLVTDAGWSEDWGGGHGDQILGYGLVVGLDGTGDRNGNARYDLQDMRQMLARLGVRIPADTKIEPKRAAVVKLSATLPPVIRVGQTIDVVASSLGNAESLRGGTLLMAPLKKADGHTYAIAYGDLVVGPRDMGPNIAAQVPSGRIPGGAALFPF